MVTTRRWTFAVCILLSFVLASCSSTPQKPGVSVGPEVSPIDTRCPCVPTSDCPRVFDATDDDDIRHFGHLPDCKDAIMVRCCGAEVEVRETVSVGFHNGSMDVFNQSMSIVQNETYVLTEEKFEMHNDQLNGTYEKVIFLKPEARSILQQEEDFNIDDPVNIISTNITETVENSINMTTSVLKANVTASLLKYVNATAEEERNEPDTASSALDIHQITPANLSQDASMKYDLLPTDASISPAPNSTDVIDSEMMNATIDAENVRVLYPSASYPTSSDNANVTVNSTMEDEKRQVSASDSSEKEITGNNNASILAVSPLSEAGNNEGMARSLEADEFDNRSENASIAESSTGQNIYETGVKLNGNSSQLYPGLAEEDQSNDTMSLESDKNDTMSMREAENEATMKRMNQIPGIMYVFPMHNMRKRKEKQTPFLVFPTKNSTDNETVKDSSMVNKTVDVFVVNSDLDSMASTAEGVSSTVKGKVIIRKFMPKVKSAFGRGYNGATKTSAVTAAPTTPNESEKSVVATDDHPQKSTTASPTRTESNATSSSIKSKPNLKYKINTRRLPSKFYIKTRANGKIDVDVAANNSSLLTQGPVANRSLSEGSKEIDINAPIRSKSIMIKRIALKSKLGATTTLPDDASLLEASGSEYREDILPPEGGADANSRAIPSRNSDTHPSRTASKGARPSLASRRRQPVAVTTEDVQEDDSTPATQTVRPRSSSFRRRPVMVEDHVSTTTAEPKKLGSYLVNIRIKPILGAADSKEATVAPVESSKVVEGVTMVPEAPLESLKLNESISKVARSTESDLMVSNTTPPAEIMASTSHAEVQDQIGNVTISEMVKSPNVDSLPTVYGSTSERPEVIVVEKQNATLVEHLTPTKARASYTRTTPRNPTSKSEIKISSRHKENGKAAENKGDVIPKASFPRRGSVRFERPKFGRDGSGEVAQESQLVGVLEGSDAVNGSVTKTVELTANKTESHIHSMKIILPASHNSAIPVKIMLSNTEEDGVIEIMLPKMETKIPMEILSQARPTRSSNNGFNPSKRVEQGVISSGRNPGFFSIVGPIPKGYFDPSLIEQINLQAPVLDLPNPHKLKKFRDTPVKRFLKPVIDVEDMKKQHHLFLLKKFNEQKKTQT